MKFDLRQITIGIVIGAIVMFSSQVAADSISKIGKKVQAEYTIKVDGKTLDAKALSIDGTTSTPNRALADAVGYNVAFVNKEVVFTKKDQGGAGVDFEKRNLQDRLNEVNGSIEDMEFFIRNYEGQFEIEGFFVSDEVRKNAEKQLADYKIKLEELQKEKANLEAQLQGWQ